MRAAESGLEIGALVAEGRYELRGCTLEGPAYVDYRAFDREVEVEVALWWMDPILFAGEAERSAFEAAAREMRGVTHDSLRRLFDVGRDRDGLYLISQAGSPDGIGQRLGSGRGATDDDLVRYASALADALETIHAAGVVHGRLVPSDLVEVAGHVKVSGAGLYGALDTALAAERWADWRRYVAPEVQGRGAVDRAADVYSMAAILAELASGISRPELGEAMAALESERPGLAEALRPALAAEARRRPGRPVELFDRIRRVLAGEPALPETSEPIAARSSPEAAGRGAARPSEAIAGRNAAWSSPEAAERGAARPSEAIPERSAAWTATGPFAKPDEAASPRAVGRSPASSLPAATSSGPASSRSATAPSRVAAGSPMSPGSSSPAAGPGAPPGESPRARRASASGGAKARPVVAPAGPIGPAPSVPAPSGPRPPVAARSTSSAADDSSRASGPMRAVEDGWELDDVVVPRAVRASPAPPGAPAGSARERLGVGSEARIEPPGAARGEAGASRPDAAGPDGPAAEPDVGQTTIEESSPLFLHPSAAPSSPLFGPNQPTLMDQRAPRGAPPPAAPSTGSSGSAAALDASGRPGVAPAGPNGPDRSGVAALGAARQRSDAAASSSTLRRTQGTLPPPVPATAGRQRATLPPGVMAPRTAETSVPPPSVSGPRAASAPGAPPPIPGSDRAAPPVVAALPSLDRRPPAEPSGEPGGPGLVVPLLSRRDPTQTRPLATPIIPALDRPEMQPVLRPLSSLRQSAPPGALGRYAPPRSTQREAYPPPPRRRAQLLAIGIATGVVFAAVALVLVLRGGTSEERAAAPPPPVSAPRPALPPPTPPAPSPVGPCPAGMTLVAGEREGGARGRFCVDRHEAPGPGEAPRLGLSLDQATSACEERGARLCQPAEWEAACRGPDGVSFPYGARYIDKRCNARGREIAASGSFPGCQSAAGAFDMSGNAAEWDADGNVRGASATDGTRGRCSELRRRGNPRAIARDRADIGFRCCADPLAKVTPSR